MQKRFHIERANGEKVGQLKYASDAAAVVGLYGNGAVVKYNGKIVWMEGALADGNAGESYDGAAETMFARIDS